MNQETVAQTVKEILAKKLNLSVDQIKGETRLTEDLGLDSFGGVEIMFDIEEAFNLKIPDSDLDQVRTVDDIVKYVTDWKSKLGQDPGPTTA